MPNQEQLAREVEETLVPRMHIHDPDGAVTDPLRRRKALCGLIVPMRRFAIPGREHEATCDECRYA